MVTSTRHLPPLPVHARVLLLATLLMTLGALLPGGLLRLLMTLPIALLAPGSALLLLFFGEKHRFDLAPAAALSVMLSMAFYPILMLTLYAMGILFSLSAVLLGTDLFIVALVLVAYLRSGSRTVTFQRFASSADVLRRSPWQGMSGSILFLLIVAIVMAAVALAMLVLPQAAPEPYTQFYLTGSSTRISQVVPVAPHTTLTVTLGVTNGTQQAQAYQVIPAMDSHPTWTARSFTLKPGQSWTGTLTGTVPPTGCVHRLSFHLAAPANHPSLRDLVVWTRTASAQNKACKG